MAPGRVAVGTVTLVVLTLLLASFGHGDARSDGLKPRTPRVAVAAPIGIALFWAFSWATHVASNLVLFLPTGVVLPFVSLQRVRSGRMGRLAGAVAAVTLQSWDDRYGPTKHSAGRPS